MLEWVVLLKRKTKIQINMQIIYENIFRDKQTL